MRPHRAIRERGGAPRRGAIGASAREAYRKRTMLAKRLGAVGVIALLGACAVPPPRAGGGYPASRAGAVSRGAVTDDEFAREEALLRGRAEARFAEQKRRVERVGRRLLETIPSHPDVQFVLVNGDPSINAGATFGQVAITSGMLNFIESDDEMAVVLGHELAHITEGHVLKGTMSGLALNVLAIVLEARAPGAGRAAGGIGQLFLNHYTQTQERAADTVGLRYAYEAGYDPRVAAGIQERLAVETPQSMSAGYFDTHPSSVERAVTARREAEDLMAQGDPPGRAEALAAQRAAEGRRSAPVDAVPQGGGLRRREPRGEAPARDSRREEAAQDTEACRRAQVYADMARDARDPAEQRDLYARALRYCPSLASARTGLDRTRAGGDDESAPADRY
jgi:peptidase M48-like protein